TDAVRTLVAYAFSELGLHRVQLGAWAFNSRALAAYANAGFTEEGRRREVVFHDGHWYDEVLMSVLEDDWWSRDDDDEED
ncbi:MAG: GNAT family N-acetyltransferase, partial [Janthinobacterium lividum]